jgi:hypothetical protein
MEVLEEHADVSRKPGFGKSLQHPFDRKQSTHKFPTVHERK